METAGAVSMIADAPGALASAAAFLRESRCADGSQEGGGSDWEVASHQWGLFISWAYHHGLALPNELVPDRVGGREFDLRFDENRQRWLKFTRPFAAGETVVMLDGRLARVAATPRQCLRRWLLCNRWLGDDVRLVGLACFGRTQRLVFFQRHLAGEVPTWAEVDGLLTGRYGLRRLPDAVLPVAEEGDAKTRGYGRGRLALFDVRPENFVRVADGTVVPFDVIPQVFSGAEARVVASLKAVACE